MKITKSKYYYPISGEVIIQQVISIEVFELYPNIKKFIKLAGNRPSSYLFYYIN